MRYWAFLDGRIAGPFEKAELLSQPGVGPDSLLCAENRSGDEPGDWTHASTCPELAGELPMSPRELLLAREAEPAGAATAVLAPPGVSEEEHHSAVQRAEALESALRRRESELQSREAEAQALQNSLNQKEFLSGQLNQKVQDLERALEELPVLRSELERLKSVPPAAAPGEAGPGGAEAPPSPELSAPASPEAPPVPALGEAVPPPPVPSLGPVFDAPAAPEPPTVPVGAAPPPASEPAALPAQKRAAPPSPSKKGLPLPAKAPASKLAGGSPAAGSVAPHKTPLFLGLAALAVLLNGLMFLKLLSPPRRSAPLSSPVPQGGPAASASSAKGTGSEAEALKARELLAGYVPPGQDGALGPKLAALGGGSTPRNGRASPWWIQKAAEGRYLVDFYSDQVDPATDSYVVFQFSVDLRARAVQALNAPAQALLAPPPAAAAKGSSKAPRAAPEAPKAVSGAEGSPEPLPEGASGGGAESPLPVAPLDSPGSGSGEMMMPTSPEPTPDSGN